MLKLDVGPMGDTYETRATWKVGFCPGCGDEGEIHIIFSLIYTGENKYFMALLLLHKYE